MIKIINWTILVFALSLLTACSGSNGIKGIAEPPTVSVKHVQFERLSWQGGQATFLLDITNPNAFTLPLSGFDYSLKLNTIEVANGEQKQSIKIPAKH